MKLIKGICEDGRLEDVIPCVKAAILGTYADSDGVVHPGNDDTVVVFNRLVDGAWLFWGDHPYHPTCAEDLSYFYSSGVTPNDMEVLERILTGDAFFAIEVTSPDEFLQLLFPAKSNERAENAAGIIGAMKR